MLVEADKPYLGHASYYEWLRATFQAKREILAVTEIDHTPNTRPHAPDERSG